MDTNQIFIDLLRDLLLKTTERKITWVMINPNAMRWVKNETPHPTTVTLQKQPSPNLTIKEIYVLTIQSPTQPLTQIDSVANQSLKQELAALFTAAVAESKRVADEKKIETFKNLLKGL